MQRPSYEHLEQRLKELEEAMDALRTEDVDAIIGTSHVLLVRIREAEEQLRRHRDRLEELVKQRTGQLIRSGAALEQELTRRRSSERQFRELAESVSDIFFAVDEELRYTYWNRATENFTGVPSAEALGKRAGEISPPCEMLILAEDLCREVLAARQPGDKIETVRFRGQEYFFELTAYLSEHGVSVFARDVTDHILMEEDLRQSEMRLRRAQSTASVGSWQVDIASPRVTLSDEMYRICGFAPGSFSGVPEEALSRVHPVDRDFVKNSIENAIRTGGRFAIEHRIVRKDGSERIVYSQGEIICGPDGKPLTVLGTVLDITVRKTLENELRKLSHRLLEIQEEERKELARELHDETGQLLTYVGLLLDKAVRLPPERVPVALKEAKDIVNQVMVQVRGILNNLRPPMLEDMGLLSALMWQIDRYTAETQIIVNLEHSGLERELPITVSLPAYRIVQEALTNAARYARVPEVRVEVRVDDHRLFLSVSDRGPGFVPEIVKSGSGIRGMRERALSTGGKLEIISSPGKGTTVTAELPLGGNAGKAA